MKWLLWKDYRHNRIILLLGLGFLLVPHLFALYALHRQASQSWGMQHPWQYAFGVSSYAGLLISLLTIALIAGSAIAGERVDRSAEFLASLPIARRTIVASKLVLVMTIAAVIWATDGALFGCLAAADSPEMGRLFPDWQKGLAMFAAVGLAISGIAWLFSSLTTSPMLSVWAGMVSPPAIIGGTAYMNHLFELRMSDDQLGLFCAGICLTLGIAGFIAGTWYYLRRVEP